jgi:hypothetical protein
MVTPGFIPVLAPHSTPVLAAVMVPHRTPVLAPDAEQCT